MQELRDIKSLSHTELISTVKELGLPAFRAKQIEEWLYAKGCSSFDEMTNLSVSLRSTLAEMFSLNNPTEITKQVSKDGTRKYLFALSDGAAVETVGIPSRDNTRLTVCFSTQAGCPIGCTFCATGRGGFVRNLSAGEIFDQVRLVSNDFGARVTGVVGMGQGEPFLNYTNVINAMKRMNNKIGLGIGARHITVSTCGIIEKINQFSNESEQFTLAVSLHSAIQSTRDQIMPGVKKHPLVDLRESLVQYSKKTGRRPTLEYAPMAGINDKNEDIAALIDFCRGMLCHVNLIPLNPIAPNAVHDQSLVEPSARISRLVDALEREKIEHSVRQSRGSDIDGACGQLRQRVTNNLN